MSEIEDIVAIGLDTTKSDKAIADYFNVPVEHVTGLRKVVAEKDAEIARLVRALEAAESRIASVRDESVEECARVADGRALWSPATMRNAGGEMTAQEIRTAKAFMRSIARAIRALRALPAPKQEGA